jgi:hypothetical protein
LAEAGFEHVVISKGKSQGPPAGNAFSNATAGPAAVLVDVDPLLARLLVAWDRLTGADRASIVARAERSSNVGDVTE